MCMSSLIFWNIHFCSATVIDIIRCKLPDAVWPAEEHRLVELGI